MVENAVVGRYAPSPTGALHLGNLRTALLAWLHVRLSDGVFLLRIDDLDQPRVRHNSASQMLDDFAWLGIDWDGEPYVQSERLDFYADAITLLQQQGLTYPCWCSRKDISQSASAPHGPTGLIYPGTCRPDTGVSDQGLAPQNRTPSLRVKVNNVCIRFSDQVAGNMRQQLSETSGDFVVRRADGMFAYQLACAVDDGVMGITDVVRGADLLDSTPRQIYLMQQMSCSVPNYWHVGLMRDEQGKRLAKRDGSDSLQQFRRQGVSAQSVVGKLAHSANLISDPDPISTKALLASLTVDTFRRAVLNMPK